MAAMASPVALAQLHGFTFQVERLPGQRIGQHVGGTFHERLHRPCVFRFGRSGQAEGETAQQVAAILETTLVHADQAEVRNAPVWIGQIAPGFENLVRRSKEPDTRR